MIVPNELSVTVLSSNQMQNCGFRTFDTSFESINATSPVCTYNSSDGGNRTISYTIQNDRSNLTLIIFETGQIVNPSSARVISSFIVSIGSETDRDIPVLSYTAADLSSANVANAVQTAGTPNVMTFTFRITNPILQNGKIVIEWPDSVDFKQNTADNVTTVTIYGTLQTIGTYSTSVSSSLKTITIEDLFDSAQQDVQDNDIVIAIDQLSNPESQITSNSFVLSTQDDSGNNIDQRSTGLTVSSTQPGTITVESYSYSNYSADSQFSFTVFASSDITPTSASLRIYWPSEVSYVSGSIFCNRISGFQNGDCNIIELSGYLQMSTLTSNAFLIAVGTFRNPLGAVAQSSWRLEVYDSSSNLIMNQISGITATSTVNTLTSVSGVREPDATTVASASNYTVTFTTSTRMLANSTIKFFFPIDQVKYNSSTTCLGNGTSIPCSFTDTNLSHFQTEVTQWCVSTGECAVSSTLSFVLQNAVNPSFVTTPISSSVIINTINQDTTLSNPTIDQITSGVQFTNPLTPGNLADIAVVKDSGTNKTGEETSYTISFTVVTAIDTGGQVRFNFPSEAVYKSSSQSINCVESPSPITKTCTRTADSNNNVSELLITDACTSGCSAGATLSYVISRVLNPGSTKPISTSFQVTTLTSAGYLIDTGTAATTSNFNLTANTFTSITVNLPTGSIVVGQVTDYQFTIVLTNSIPSSGGELLITFPSEITVLSNGSCSAAISSTSHT